MARPTLKDVADRVGVSAKTVSNVVNGTGWVTAELRERVQAALVEVGYRPNSAARQLRSGRTGMLAVALPDLSQPYFAELAAELVREAQARSITVLVNQTDGRADIERRISEGIGSPEVDGLIMSPLALGARDLEGRRDTTPLVLLGEHIGESVLPHVTVDNSAAARAATEHLLSLGCRRIVAIGAQSEGPNETSVLRLSGYREALTAAGLEVDESLILPVDGYHRADGAHAARTLLEAGTDFDAVFAFNDLLALGALHVLVTSGIRVPDDVAVIGFDDIEEARYSTPALSSVSPDTTALVRTALDLLAPDPAGSDSAPAPSARGMHTIGFTVVDRASTRGPAE